MITVTPTARPIQTKERFMTRAPSPTSIAIYVDDSLGKGLWRFLWQIVTNPPLIVRCSCLPETAPMPEETPVMTALPLDCPS
jgi:hypothetical protein